MLSIVREIARGAWLGQEEEEEEEGWGGIPFFFLWGWVGLGWLGWWKREVVGGYIGIYTNICIFFSSLVLR